MHRVLSAISVKMSLVIKKIIKHLVILVHNATRVQNALQKYLLQLRQPNEFFFLFLVCVLKQIF